MKRKVVFTKDYLQIARYIAEYYHLKNNQKINRIMYFLYIEYLKETNGEALFSGEFEAWIYCPIHRKTFEYMKKEHFNYATTWNDLGNDEQKFEEVLNKRQERYIKELEDEDKIYFIDTHIGKYLKYGLDLLNYFSQQTRPWIEARSGLDDRDWKPKRIINHDTLLNYALNEFDWKKIIESFKLDWRYHCYY